MGICIIMHHTNIMLGSLNMSLHCAEGFALYIVFHYINKHLLDSGSAPIELFKSRNNIKLRHLCGLSSTQFATTERNFTRLYMYYICIVSSTALILHQVKLVQHAGAQPESSKIIIL